eukprot:1159203-Pelagomonas_calceolata.AAC.2
MLEVASSWTALLQKPARAHLRWLHHGQQITVTASACWFVHRAAGSRVAHACTAALDDISVHGMTMSALQTHHAGFEGRRCPLIMGNGPLQCPVHVRLCAGLLGMEGPTLKWAPLHTPGLDHGQQLTINMRAAGDGGAGAQVGASLHPTPWSTATGASLCQAGERRMSTGSPAAGGGDPAGTPAALFAGVGGGVGGGAGGREAGLVAEAAVDAAAAAAVPLGGSGGVAVPVEREPHSRSCHPGSPPQLGAGGAGSAATVGRVREGCAHAGERARPGGSTRVCLRLTGLVAKCRCAF